jgi:hypothetical protein
MKLVRFVSDPQSWIKAFIRRDDGTTTVPLMALRAFTPTDREGQCVSLYRLDATIPDAEIVSAWWLITKENFVAVSVDEDRLIARGLSTTSPPGDTYHTRVNPLHVDLMIKSAADAVAAAEEFFLHGTLLPFQDQEIHSQIANDNNSGHIDFQQLGRKKASNSQGKLCELLAKGTLSLC